jgi:hypothetical protein
MKKTTKFIVAVGLLLTCISLPNFRLNAQLLFEENFDYPAGDSLVSHGYTAHAGSKINSLRVTNQSLTYIGYASSGKGSSVLIDTTGEDVNIGFAKQTQGIVYVAMLVNIKKATTTGDYFLHLGPSPLGNKFRGKIYVKKDKAGLLHFGVGILSGTPMYSASSYSLNTNHLLVLKYQIANPVKDSVSLYVNPCLSYDESMSESVSWDTATVASSNFGSLAFRQGSSTQAPRLLLGAVRVSTNWSDALFLNAPSICNISITPKCPVISGNPMAVRANITDDDSVAMVKFFWSKDSNQIGTMVDDSIENTYNHKWNIPAQLADTIYFKIIAQDNHGLIDSIVDRIYITPANVHIRDLKDISTMSNHSIYSGFSVTTKGIVTAVRGDGSYFIRDGEEAWDGIYVNDFKNLVEEGDSVELTSLVHEFNGNVELYPVSIFKLINTSNQLPNPVPLLANEINRAYDGLLIRVVDVKCIAIDDYSNVWMVNDDETSDSIRIDNSLCKYSPQLQKKYTLTGIAYYSENNLWLFPRTAADITFTDGISQSQPLEIKLYPNPVNHNFSITNLPENCSITIFNILGEKAVSMGFKDGKGIIDVNFLTEGTYQVLVTNDKGNAIFKQSIIKK